MAGGASGKTYTQAELDKAVLEANLYLGDNLHEAFGPDDITEAVELLNLKEHERPEGFVSWNGHCFVRAGKIADLFSNSMSVEQVRAACALLLTECAEAEALLEEQVRSDAYEMNGAGAVTP